MKSYPENYCFEENEHFIRKKKTGVLTLINRSIFSDAIDLCIQSPDIYLDKSTILKDEDGTKAGIAVLDDNSKIFIKKYTGKNISYSFKYMFRNARPVKVWRVSWLLENNNILFPKSMAIITTRKCRLLGDCYLFTQVIDNAVQSDRFYESTLIDSDHVVEFCSRVMDLLANIHRLGIVHGDCKLSNFFVENHSETNYKIGIWDLDGASINNTVSSNIGIADITRFIAAVIEKSYKLNLYLNTAKLLEHCIKCYENKFDFYLNLSLIELGVRKHLKRKNINYQFDKK